MRKHTEKKLLRLINFCKDENIDISAVGNIYVMVGNGKMQEEVRTSQAIICKFTKLSDFEVDVD